MNNSMAMMEEARKQGKDPMAFALHQQEILRYMEKNSDELVSFEDYEDLTPEENFTRMCEAAEYVKTATVTYAIRDSEFNGMTIKEGDIIGLHNGQIEFTGPSAHSVAIETLRNVVEDEDELISVYYGADVSEDDAKALTEELTDLYPDCDVEYHNGGQPLYYYLISVE